MQNNVYPYKPQLYNLTRMMFIKHYAPCIKVAKSFYFFFGGGAWGRGWGIRVDVN